MERELTVGWIGDGKSIKTAFCPDIGGLPFKVSEDHAKAKDKTVVRVRVVGTKAQLDALEAKIAKA